MPRTYAREKLDVYKATVLFFGGRADRFVRVVLGIN